MTPRPPVPITTVTPVLATPAPVSPVPVTTATTTPVAPIAPITVAPAPVAPVPVTEAIPAKGGSTVASMEITPHKANINPRGGEVVVNRDNLAATTFREAGVSDSTMSAKATDASIFDEKGHLVIQGKSLIKKGNNQAHGTCEICKQAANTWKVVITPITPAPVAPVP